MSMAAYLGRVWMNESWNLVFLGFFFCFCNFQMGLLSLHLLL